MKKSKGKVEDAARSAASKHIRTNMRGKRAVMYEKAVGCALDTLFKHLRS